MIPAQESTGLAKASADRVREWAQTKAPSLARRHAGFILVFILCAFYAGANLYHGWVPHDDGALGQSAERVLAGELPHRDFVEIYSGALDYLHALSFVVFGKTLTSMRLVLFFAYLIWLPAVYRIALHFAPPIPAATTSLLAAMWSIPFYSAPMPSWYNLFLASFAILCFLEFEKDSSRTRYWIFFAGACCSISFLIKVTGLYALAAALLACVGMAEGVSENKPSLTVGRSYMVFVTVSMATFVLSVARLFRGHMDADEIFAFVVPCLAVTAALARTVTQNPRGASDRTRFASLARLLLPLLLGFALPVCFFVIMYARNGATRALLYGALVLPLRRVSATLLEPSAIRTTYPAFLLALFLGAAATVRLRSWVQAGIMALIVGVFLLRFHHSLALQQFWHSAFDIVPYFSMVTALLLVTALDAPARGRICVVLSFVVCCNLSRFPFYHAIYFCYVAPLLIIGILAVISTTPRRSPLLLAGSLIFYVLFAVFAVKPGFVRDMGYVYSPHDLTVPFHIQRASGIRAEPATVAEYQNIISAVLQHSRSDYIYAGPDAPEIYFLAAKRNPTPDIFDFLDPQAVQNTLRALDRYPIDVVVLTRDPQFSRVDPMVRERIEHVFPKMEKYEHFDVRWR